MKKVLFSSFSHHNAKHFTNHVEKIELWRNWRLTIWNTVLFWRRKTNLKVTSFESLKNPCTNHHIQNACSNEQEVGRQHSGDYKPPYNPLKLALIIYRWHVTRWVEFSILTAWKHNGQHISQLFLVKSCIKSTKPITFLSPRPNRRQRLDLFVLVFKCFRNFRTRFLASLLKNVDSCEHLLCCFLIVKENLKRIFWNTVVLRYSRQTMSSCFFLATSASRSDYVKEKNDTSERA